jgi:hypothetical protein
MPLLRRSNNQLSPTPAHFNPGSPSA